MPIFPGVADRRAPSTRYRDHTWCPDLLVHLAAVPDPRGRRGRRYPLPAVLAVAVCAVLAGARSLTAIGEWAAEAPPQVLVALGIVPSR